MVTMIPTQVSQTQTSVYWGEGGEYGPFDIQQEGDWAGWPNAGQVLRYFRKRAKLSARAFGELYGKTVNADGRAIGERWILDMETDNKVPVDIGRRKTIAELLNIPPMLFGLAVLESVSLVANPQTAHTVGDGQTIIRRSETDIEKCQADIRTRWKLFATSDAGDTMAAIERDLQHLEQLETQAKGDLLYCVQELLFSNYFLASVIAEDKRQFDKQYSYANNAVRAAKAMDDADLVATALYARGCAYLFWGLYGSINEKGIFVVDRKLLNNAVQDFEQAKKSAHPQLEGTIITELSRTQAHLGMKNAPLANLDMATNLIGVDNINDPYTRQLIAGTYSGFHKGRYLVRRARTLNAAGFAIDALKDIKDLRKLNENTYGVDETRRFALIDILEAESYLQIGDYYKATDSLKKALRVFQHLHIMNNIAITTDLYGRLLGTPYGKSTDVEELGEMLGKGKQL